MKAIAVGLAALLALSMCGCAAKDEPEPEIHVPPNALIRQAQQADNTTPSGAVAGLLDAVIGWDMGVAAQFLTDTGEDDFSAYRTVLLPFMERIEYELGAEKITRETAVVDVGIMAVDAGSALGDMTVAAAQYAIAQALTGEAVDIQNFATHYLSESLDFDSLTRTRRNVSVHLTLDSMGRWRLDSANADNADFYNALTGGALETVKDLRDLAKQYNVW